MYEFNLTKIIMELYSLASGRDVNICIDIYAHDRLNPYRKGITITISKGVYHNSYRYSIEELKRMDHPDAVMYMFESMVNEILNAEARNNRRLELFSGVSIHD